MTAVLLALLVLAAPVVPAAARSEDPVQHGAQPNPGEVRPGSPEGDAPSAATGSVVRDPVRHRVFGLPITAALVIAAILVVLFVVAGLVVPRSWRRSRARGGGSYGR